MEGRGRKGIEGTAGQGRDLQGREEKFRLGKGEKKKGRARIISARLIENLQGREEKYNQYQRWIAYQTRFCFSFKYGAVCPAVGLG